MGSSKIILIANPGSASRKFGLYHNAHEQAQLHFELEYNKVVCTLQHHNRQSVIPVQIHDLREAAASVVSILQQKNLLRTDDHITDIGIRIVAPGAYFLQDRLVDDACIAMLQALQSQAPIHIGATLNELHTLRQQFPNTPVWGLSDSAFHSTKPDYAWNYGIPLEDADRLDIKRFGYHGLSVAAAVRQLEHTNIQLKRLVICHLGSGASVTAVLDGKSVDTTMGYSPLEGIIMSTRSGTIDPTAIRALQTAFRLSDTALDNYLNNHSGLLGLGGSADIRELLRRERDGDHRSHLALTTYIYSIQKAIGQMTAALGGVDALAFTGTVGERSAPIRQRVVAPLGYLDLLVDTARNNTLSLSAAPVRISPLEHSKPVYVIQTNESVEMARHITSR